MTTLAISASRRQASVALELRGAIAVTPGESANSSLHEQVAAICRDAGIAPRDIDRVVVDRGPGSYTGLRIAVTFARFLSRYDDVELLATTSFEAIAAAAEPGRTLRIGLDARRGRVHTARVAAADRIALLEEPRAIPLDEFVALLDADDHVVLDGSLHEAVAREGIELTAIPEYDATSLLSRRITPSSIGCDELEPLYLMGSYAD